MLGRLQTWLDLWVYARRSTREQARLAASDVRDATVEMRARGDDVQTLRLLDIGCGALFPTTLLFHSIGARATGIDVDTIPLDTGFGKYRVLWVAGGAERALKTLVRSIFFDSIYYEELERASEVPLRWDGVDLRQMDATELMFEDETFDWVVSSAVWEHILYVPRAVSELHRVLKPGGMARINIHLFPSLSGGHHPAWAYPDSNPPRDVPPWDHLRQNRYPVQGPLNRLRERDFLALFQQRFEVVRWVPYPERGARRFLTEEIRKELADYSEEELLIKGVSFTARKRPASSTDHSRPATEVGG